MGDKNSKIVRHATEIIKARFCVFIHELLVISAGQYERGPNSVESIYNSQVDKKVLEYGSYECMECLKVITVFTTNRNLSREELKMQICYRYI